MPETIDLPDSCALPVDTGRRCRVRIEVIGALDVAVPVDPNDPTTHDDKFTLRSDDGAYECAKVIADGCKSETDAVIPPSICRGGPWAAQGEACLAPTCPGG